MTADPRESRPGLGRFVGERRPLTPGAMSPYLSQRLSRREAGPSPGETCDMCQEQIPEAHAHVVNIEARNLLCTCRSCFLLFTHEGAAQGRYRAVPERYLYDSNFGLTDQAWDELQIPVSMAFFFMNSGLGTFAGFYPSPAGATESLLDLDAWKGVLDANPSMATVAADVEALLVRRGDDGFEGFLVPIDACYELVGIVKLGWKGFHGGEAVWDAIDRFFEQLRQRSRPVDRSTDGQAMTTTATTG